MSTPAIDTARTSERLNFLMTKLLKKEPIDQFFQARPALDYFWKHKEVKVFGRQARVLLDSDQNPNFLWFASGDTFATNVPNTVRNALFAGVNAGTSVVVDIEEQLEASTDDDAAYDIVKHRKDSAQRTIEHNVNIALNATGNANDRIVGLPNLVDATSTVGGLNRSTAGNEYWQANVRTTVGAFSANGMTEMRTAYNLITEEVGEDNKPDFCLTTRAIHESFEAEADPDVRHADPEELRRGALRLVWKGMPIVHDVQVDTGEMYFLNKKYIKLIVDSRMNMAWDPFLKSQTGTDMVGKFLLRVAMVVTQPRGLSKLTGIT